MCARLTVLYDVEFFSNLGDKDIVSAFCARPVLKNVICAWLTLQYSCLGRLSFTSKSFKT